jgi:50S ribosomal subunit-associated GTPase HflX
MIDDILAASKKKITFEFPFDMQSAVNYLYKNATVENVEYTENGTLVTAFVTEKETGLYNKYIKE